MIYLQEGYTKRIKDIINAYNCFLKNAVFSIKASNGQFIIVLDGIICFSVRVCDNSLLVLKISFSGLFFLKQKRYKSLPMTGRYNCRFYQCFFFCKIMPQVFEILIFDQDIWENVHYVPKISLISQGTLIKAFHLPSKMN